MPALGNSYSAMEGIEGQRYSDLEKYKANCPACMSVVQTLKISAIGHVHNQSRQMM
ncbi:TPA: hypothetical protein QHZ54_001600 [Proteus mirabilis]|nr:hypothetical protein [Proteus mirabilis]